MKKFRINELTGSNEGTNGNGPHGMRSPSSQSLASSSTSLNHQAPDRLGVANNNATNMVHSSEPQRANQFYQTENNFILSHNDNINWRDEADGSEEEECRLNVLPNSTSEVQTTNVQSNLFAQQPHSSSNLLTHQAPLFTSMAGQDLRPQQVQLNNNCADSNRASADKNLESNFKEKQLRETEFCINRIEDLLVSFKNLFKPDESEQQNCGSEGIINNFSSNRVLTSYIGRKSAHTVPKLTNNSNLANYTQTNFQRVSNQFAPNASNITVPKNTHQVNDSAEDHLRNSKNSRKVSNNRHTFQSDFQQQAHVSSMTPTESSDFNEPPPIDVRISPNVTEVDRIDEFYHQLNGQINILRRRLETLSSTSECRESNPMGNSFNFNDAMPTINQNFSNGTFLCDCCPESAAGLHVPESDESSSNYMRSVNQQVYQLLIYQNYQINQQHQLIQSWIHTQQKWIDKQSESSFKLPLSHPHRHSAFVPGNSVNHGIPFIAESHLMNNFHHHSGGKSNFLYTPESTLNNQTEPRSRANNFFDNFRSHSHQNKLQSNLDIGTAARESYSVGGQHGSNCSNSCINISPCNKNSRSQSFAGFGGSQKRAPQNNFAPNLGNLQYSGANFGNGIPPGSLPQTFEKKMNTNVGNNLQQLNKFLTMVGKMTEPDSAANPGNLTTNQTGNFQAKPNLLNARLGYSPFTGLSTEHKNSFKRKKMSNVSSNVDPGFSEQALHEDVFDTEEDDHDSVDLEAASPFEATPRVHGSQGEPSPSIFDPPTTSGPTTLPNFHMDKCTFQVPLTISPHTGAIRKKPIYDCNFKFAASDAATDNQKLSMQHNTQEKSDSGALTSASVTPNESVRPLMPAEGRSSEQLLSTAPPMVNMPLKPKLSNSLPKYSTRPPITGAGNDSTGTVKPPTSYTHSSHDSLVTAQDDDIKWNKLNSDGSIASTDKDAHDQGHLDSPCDGSDDREVNRTELSSTVEDERQLEGSTDAKPELHTNTKGDSSFLTSSGGVSIGNPSMASACTSSLNAETTSSSSLEGQQVNGVIDNGHHSVMNGRFHPDEVVRLNGHHHRADNLDDDDFDEDLDTDSRLFTVRLRGDGEPVRSTGL